MSTIRLLHGTSYDKWLKISEQGLHAQSYLTSSEEMAQYFAEEAADQDKSEPVVLRVSAYSKDLRPDYTMYDEPLTLITDYVSEDQWFEDVESGELDYPKDQDDWQTSLDVVQSVISKAPIPPDHITVLGSGSLGSFPDFQDNVPRPEMWTVGYIVQAVKDGFTFLLPFKLGRVGSKPGYYILGEQYFVLVVTVGPEHTEHIAVTPEGWLEMTLWFQDFMVPTEAFIEPVNKNGVGKVIASVDPDDIDWDQLNRGTQIQGKMPW